MPRTEEEQAEARRMYDRLRDDLMKRDLSNTENYDRAIFTVSSTFLGASIAFIKFIVPWDQAILLPLLVGCWGFLFIALTFSIFAYQLSNKALAIRKYQGERYYLHEEVEAFNEKNPPETWNKFLNVTAGVLLVLAMLMLITFVSINIIRNPKPEEPPMTTKNEITHTNLEKKSAAVPTMERVPGPRDNIGNSASVPTLEKVPVSSKPSADNSGGNDDTNS